jgi:hypothetical protein
MCGLYKTTVLGLAIMSVKRTLGDVSVPESFTIEDARYVESHTRNVMHDAALIVAMKDQV